MRVRILNTIYYDGNKHYHAGEVVDVSAAKAEVWLKKGLAMQDKSMDGASKTKKKLNRRLKNGT